MSDVGIDKKFQFAYEGPLYDTASALVGKKCFPELYLKSRAKWLMRIMAIGK